MELILLIPIIASFISAMLLLPFWIRKANEIGLVWPDMNKSNRPKVAGSGGITAVFGFIIGVLLFVAYRVFIFGSSDNLVEVLTILVVIVMVAGIGLIDDLFGWQKGGLSRRSRMILVAISAIPLMAINAGENTISLFGSQIDIGLIYALMIIPIGLMGATTTFNFLAGFNGLEAGLGIITLGGLSIVSYFGGQAWLAVVGLCMCAALLAFLIYNKFPAKTFPGDVITYPIGALIASMAVIGNFEKIAMFFFIPYFIEIILKSRGKLVKHSFGKPMKDGTLDLAYDKLYGLTHVGIFLLKKMGIKSDEKNIVYIIWAFQAIVIVAGFWIFREGIFG